MYPLLILREEIVCLIILIYLMINGRFYKMGKDHGSFMRMSIYAMGHVAFDIITVLTVNRLEVVPGWVNYMAHVIFYVFAILFSQEFLCYIMGVCFSKKREKAARKWALIPIAVYLLLLPLLPIEYLVGAGTNYSLGLAAFVGYGLAMMYFLASAVLMAVRFKRIAPHMRMALIPMLVVMVTAEIVQIAVPELLFTGGVATIVTVGFFFSLENPADVFKQKLLVDALTGVKSRHSYELDIEEMEAEYLKDKTVRYGMVFCDINNLKAVNDLQGHLEGDAYIGQIAQVLMRDLRSAEGIYRMGGDEFLAVYRGKDESVIQRETDQVNRDCAALSEGLPYRMSVAIGCAISGEQYPDLREVLRIADYMMYMNKAEMKKHMAFASENGEELNITGLTDRIFDAFAATGDRNYLTLCNISTNVSRWSKGAVEYFGLPGEFIFDSATLWMSYIHPDDRADYWAEISDVFGGRKKYHDLEYRVRNKDGEYVTVTCRGNILKGKNGDPDMFAATLVNHGIAEDIDPVTGLHSDRVLVRYVEERVESGKPTTFLAVSIFTFSRINMLYGYAKGNQALKQLVSLAQNAAGPGGRVFRMGGTKFVICLPTGDPKVVMDVYRNLQDAALREITLDSLVIPLRLAGGAVITDQKYTDSVANIRNSMTHALERSKQEYHGRLVFHNDRGMGEAPEDDKLLTAIHQDAVADRKGFYLRYQPIVEMESGRIIGGEALLRWRDDTYGEVGPGRFVPWLENDPCFYQLGRWILVRALAEGKEMLELCPGFVVNVNVTVLQLEDERFSTLVLEALRETGFPPGQLCLELTERCRELDFEYLHDQIELFHSYGVQVALDDVGTGFSSLSVLLKLPVDEMKLDMSFITDIRRRRANQVFVQAMVEAAQRLGYHSCLEGVEDKETYEYLKGYGATSYQGYYFSKPLPAEELKELLRRQKDGEILSP